MGLLWKGSGPSPSLLCVVQLRGCRDGSFLLLPLAPDFCALSYRGTVAGTESGLVLADCHWPWEAQGGRNVSRESRNQPGNKATRHLEPTRVDRRQGLLCSGKSRAEGEGECFLGSFWNACPFYPHLPHSSSPSFPSSPFSVFLLLKHTFTLNLAQQERQTDTVKFAIC